MLTHNPDQGRARALVETLNRRLITEAARRRQGPGRAEGARAPLGLAQPRRVLVEITGRDRQGRPHQVTPLGYKTAVRALPPVLAGLEASDPRRHAADMLADAAERVSGASGAGLEGGAVKDGVSDGGATTRVKWAARLRLAEAGANGWPVDRRFGVLGKGPERVALPVTRKGRKRQEIKAWPLVWAVAVEARDMAQICAAHGWSLDSGNRRKLTEATLEILDNVAEALGLGRAIARKPLDR